MRDIKFRAWFIDGENKTLGAQVCSKQGEKSLAEFLADIEDVDKDHGYKHILMQYTGLKDKNGKDIYEGDILGGGSFKWEVRWSISNGFIGIIKNNQTRTISDIIKQRKRARCPISIMGNIHENKELLEG